MKRLFILLVAMSCFPCAFACSATKAMANAMSGGATSVFAEDDDPELVRASVPFGLKMMEAVLNEQPDHVGLLTSLTSGYAQYAYAFAQSDADRAEFAGKITEANALRARARKLYLRARDFGLRGLEERHEGMVRKLRSVRDLDAAVARLERDDIPLAYWTAASWALAIASAKDDVALLGELPIPGALMRRALELDETWDHGAIHDFFVSWEMAQGGVDAFSKATAHFHRAVDLSKGKRLGVMVSYAESVCVAKQDRAEFTRILQQVVASDPGADKAGRLANVIAQRRAKALLEHIDDLFT